MLRGMSSFSRALRGASARCAEPRIDAVLETAAFYRLKSSEAEKVVSQVRAVVSEWKVKAESLGLPRAELQRMESAFEHDAD